jgi:hypothetical protein
MRRYRGLVSATVVTAVAAMLFSGAVVRAWRVEPTSPAALYLRAGLRDEAAVPAHAGEPLTEKALGLAADHDPFQPDRIRPAERYRLPGDIEPAAASGPEPPPAPPFRVIGTAVTSTGGLAVVQVEETTPRVVAMGESLLGYTLESVDPESATLVGQGRSLTLPVTKQAPPPAPREARAARGRAGAAQNARDPAAREAQMMEMLRRQMQERGLGENVHFENGRVIIRPPLPRDTLDAPAP